GNTMVQFEQHGRDDGADYEADVAHAVDLRVDVGGLGLRESFVGRIRKQSIDRGRNLPRARGVVHLHGVERHGAVAERTRLVEIFVVDPEVSIGRKVAFGNRIDAYDVDRPVVRAVL